MSILLTKAARYQRALTIGLTFLVIEAALFFLIVQSQMLLADIIHGIVDMLTLAGTACIESATNINEHALKRKKRHWLLFGVLSLALGGFLITGESIWHIINTGTSHIPPPWQLLVIALVGAMVNWKMHGIIDGIDEKHALDHNNLDHIKWDMILSGSVFISGVLMWIFGSTAIDHYIAIFAGIFIFPHLAWKRWHQEDEHSHVHDHQHKHDSHSQE